MSQDIKDSVTNSAFSQARKKLKYTAFIELNQTSVVDVMYSDDDIKLYKGMRVLGIDGSKIILPQNPETIEEFGKVEQKNGEIDVNYSYAMASVMYDVLNRIAIDSKLDKIKSYEVDLAIELLKYSKDNDLLIYDRGYPSYRHVSHLISAKRNFVMRCSKASFSKAREMLKGEGSSDQVVTIKVHHSKKKEIKNYKLPQEVKVRFVRVVLDTDEYEVLVTNLLDRDKFTTNEFKDIYYMRWGVESFYAILKTRLNLENFSGKTVHSIYQDFYSTIYLAGIESLLTEDINEELSQKETQNEQKVNHNVSFNGIKNKALDLLFSSKRVDNLIEKLEILFKTNPVQIRSKRKVIRKKSSSYKLLNYHKRTKKICF